MRWRNKKHKVRIRILASSAAKYTNNPVPNPLPSVKTAGALPPSHKHTYGVKSLVLVKGKGGGDGNGMEEERS
jgi:hypothetical protein